MFSIITETQNHFPEHSCSLFLLPKDIPWFGVLMEMQSAVRHQSLCCLHEFRSGDCEGVCYIPEPFSDPRALILEDNTPIRREMCPHQDEADQICVDLRDECYSNYIRAARAPRLIQTSPFL